MLSKIRQYKVSIIAVVAMLLFVALYRSYHSMVVKRSVAPQPVSVSVATVLNKPMTVSFKAMGNVSAYQSVEVKSQIDGTVMQVAFDAGQIVQKDQLLFVIDPRPAQAQLRQAEADLMKDQAQLKNAKLITERNKSLIKKSYVSQSAYDQDQTTQEMQTAAVLADEAAIENAKLKLSYSHITAPFTGRTGDVELDVGNVVQAAQSTILTTVKQLQPINVTFSVPQKYLPVVSAYRETKIPVTLHLHNQLKQGVLMFVDNQVNTETGTTTLKAVFANEDLQLLPGASVEVNLPVARFNQIEVVPAGAIQEGAKGKYVFVLNTNNTASYREVQTDATLGSETIITKGLQTGEKVITSGQSQLVEGTVCVVRS